MVSYKHALDFGMKEGINVFLTRGFFGFLSWALKEYPLLLKNKIKEAKK